MEFQKLESKVKYYWMVIRCWSVVLSFLSLLVCAIFIPSGYKSLGVVPTFVLFSLSVFWAIILPILEVKVYRYYIDDEKILIHEGVVFKRFYVIPIIQIQDTGVISGPLMQVYNISLLEITTAGSNKFIKCINSSLAQEIASSLQEKIQNRLTVSEE